MKKMMLTFWSEENGQDLVEYALLLAFVAFASAALYENAGGSISGIWAAVKGQLQAGNAVAL